ncbi:hypothetical protein BKA62DRAFT_621347 [Auriculariales sp. MPI-PUGE-AT-0066]|nr:hypothetical protein BKA62DRAFT_621347 [Auriculariales sp. MPI-PUGE-AT-0066]
MSARFSQPETIPHMREALWDIESRMRSLADQKYKLESRLAAAVALQTPIRRLPREVLASIFTVGVDRLDGEDPLFLTRVTLVCRDWRDTALASPELWARIRIDHHGGLRRAQRRITLSKAVPLDIDIDFTHRDRGPNLSPDVVLVTVSRALDLLRSETYRWRKFAFRVQHAAPAHAALARCTERAPQLTHFALHVHLAFVDSLCTSPVNVLRPPRGSGRDTPPLLFGGYTPLLSTVELGSAPLPSAPDAVGGILMRGLRSLRLNGNCGAAPPTVADLIQVLHACPALETLALRNMEDVYATSYFCSPGYDVDYPMHTAVPISTATPSSALLLMPRLRQLAMSFCGPTRAAGLLGQLALPALERAEFAHMDNISGALKALKHSVSSLRTLRVENSLFDELRLMRLLRRLTKLSELELVECEDVSLNLLKGLSCPPSKGHEWILPSLSTLSLDGCAGADWEPLRTLVEHRAQTLDDVSPIYLLDVSRCPQMSRERVQWLRMYVRNVRSEASRSVW